jgi:putative heme-binding domain-containing protein
LVALLGHRNAWHRETTSRLLFERQDMSVLSALEKLVEDGEQPLARVHALYSLRGLSRLTGDRVLIALRDIDPRVREHAVRLSEGHAEDPAIRGRLAELVDDPDGRVRFQLALTSGQFELAWRLPILVKLANAFAGDVWMRTAILSSLADGAGNMFAEILSNPAFLARDENGPFIDELASQVAHANQPDELAMILKAVEAASRVNPDVAGRVIATLGQYNTDLKERIASSSAGTLLAKMIQSARTIVQDETRSEIERSQAAATLALGAFETEGPILLGLIDSHQPAGLQTAALRSLARFDSPEVMDTLIRQWRTLGPAARAESEELIFSRPSRVDRFLKAVDLGTVPLREVPAWRLRTLASSPNIDSSTKALVESISARIDKTPRDEFVRAYEGSLELPGDVNRGRIVFQLHCATCHRVRGDGHDVGPAMESVRNRGKQAILLSVLDPNREVPPQYINYVLHTKEGIAHSGIIAAETANSVTLKQADNKTHVVFRDDIEELVSSGSSIMPEGFEKQIDAQAMADLLEFVLAEP